MRASSNIPLRFGQRLALPCILVALVQFLLFTLFLYCAFALVSVIDDTAVLKSLVIICVALSIAHALLGIKILYRYRWALIAFLALSPFYFFLLRRPLAERVTIYDFTGFQSRDVFPPAAVRLVLILVLLSADIIAFASIKRSR